mmetsp:Transcript_168/g.273  ORF Transcript_168/g.273 Transcript_168/m.273 type:complete len:248 (+) Transcript_168:45-788(+)
MASSGGEGALIRHLESFWNAACERFQVPDNLRQQWMGTIVERYQERHRAYHTLHHLDELFKYRTEHQDELKRPHLVTMAVFFHDIIYNPKQAAPANEVQSALEFARFAREANAETEGKSFSKEETGLVEAWIRKTADHVCTSEDSEDCKLFMDWDIAILGQPWPRYETYMNSVRTEFRHIPYFIWCVARPRFLRKMLEQKQVFATDHYQKLFGRQAEDNISEEIRILESEVGFLGRMAGKLILYFVS